MTKLPYIQATDRVVGAGSSVYADTLNAALREVLTLSGLNPDNDFPGFAQFAAGVQPTADGTDRDSKYPPATATIGTVVLNQGAHRVERLRPDRKWEAMSETPAEWVNPRSFTLAGWYDANGITTVGVGRNDLVTQAEITAHTEWMGRYYTTDTRDYVCLQEALYHAFATQGPNGQGDIAWQGANAPLHPVWIPAGNYNITRELWAVAVQGGRIEGAGRFQCSIGQTTRNARIFWTDGFSYSTITGIRFVANTGSTYGMNLAKPLLDLDFYGTGGALPQVENGLVVSAADFTTFRPVTAAANPSLTTQVAGTAWTQDQWKDYFLVMTGGMQQGHVYRILGNTPAAVGANATIYIDGQWEFFSSTGYNGPPAAGNHFAIVSSQSQVGHLIYCENNFASFDDADISALGIVDGTTQALLCGVNSTDTTAGTAQAVTIASHTKASIAWNNVITVTWYEGSKPLNVSGGIGYGQPYPNGRSNSKLINDLGAVVVLTGTTYQGTVVSANNTCSLSVSGVAWANNDHAGFFAEIVAGTGAGQILPVRGNNANTLFFDDWSANLGTNTMYAQMWTTLPDATSQVRFLSRPSFYTEMQSNTISHCYLETQGGPVAVGIAVTRCGGDYAMGSENQFLHNTIGGFYVAGLFAQGFNALNNLVVGGNFESCPTHGILFPHGGNIDVWRTHFGNGGDSQRGFDLFVDGGVEDMCTMHAVRSESRKLISATNQQYAHIYACMTLNPPSGRQFAANDGHVWTPGDFLVNEGGSMVDGVVYRVVKVTGDGTAGALTGQYPVPGQNFQNEGTSAASTTGGTITIRRYDYFCASVDVIDHCIFTYGQVSAGKEVRAAYFTRRDWLAAGVPRTSYVHVETAPPNQGGTPLPWYPGVCGNAALAVNLIDEEFLHRSALVWSWLTSDTTMFGLGPADATGNAIPLLALYDGASEPTTIFGKPAASGTDVAGKDAIFAAGQGTGAGVGGKVRLQIAEAGTAGTAVNALTDALVLSAGPDKLMHSFGARVVGKQATTVAPGGAVTPIPYETLEVEITTGAAGSITINNPGQALTDGQRFLLIVWNNSGAAQTVTLGSAFKGTFTGPGTGLSSSQLYEYSAYRSAFVPVGAQSAAV